MRSLLVFGWPATMKSTSGDLVARHYGVTHYNTEEPKGIVGERDLHAGWEAVLRGGRDDLFVRAVATHASVVTGGWSPEAWPLLNAVARCRLAAGATLVWLHGEREELRRRWIKRQQEKGLPNDPAPFDTQADRLDRYEAMWWCVFAPNIIDVTAGSLSLDELAARLIALAGS